MREIKFRAWDADAGEMIYSDKDYTDTYFFEFVDHKLKCIGIDPDGFPGDQWSPPGPSSYVIENIMQYTGLKDRNGREIYEGDIVSFLWGHSPLEYRIFGVQFLFGSFMYVPANPIGAWNIYINGIMYEKNQPEIIGNIYESPELLK